MIAFCYANMTRKNNVIGVSFYSLTQKKTGLVTDSIHRLPPSRSKYPHGEDHRAAGESDQPKYRKEPSVTDRINKGGCHYRSNT